MEHLGLQIELAAPTGRASKRISDTTGREARTLHRLLEYNFNNNSFNRNADYPVEADVIIIDEMSMVEGGGAWFATSKKDVTRNENYPVLLGGDSDDELVQVGAELAQEDEKAQLFVRYWLGNDKNNAIVQKMIFSKSYKEKGISGKDVQHMKGNP